MAQSVLWISKKPEFESAANSDKQTTEAFTFSLRERGHPLTYTSLFKDVNNLVNHIKFLCLLLVVFYHIFLHYISHIRQISVDKCYRRKLLIIDLRFIVQLIYMIICLLLEFSDFLTRQSI